MAACFPAWEQRAAILTLLSAMTSLQRHQERHGTEHLGRLRAAVLGAAVTSSSHRSILITGVAGLVAGAMSMAAGEYIPVHSQADTEKADLFGAPV